MEPRKARQRSGAASFLLAAKIAPEIIPVVIMPEIVPVAIISLVVGKGMRRYGHGRPSPESRRPDVVPAVVSIHPDVARSWTGGPHHRQRRGRAETDTY
jgi:hypothetical protein